MTPEEWFAVAEVWLAMNPQCQNLGSSLLDVVQMLQLQQAGWTPEFVEQQHQPTSVMSWYWRRPPRRKNSKGKVFLSTSQAWNRMHYDNKTEAPWHLKY